MKLFKSIKLMALLPFLLVLACNKDKDPEPLIPEVVSTIPVMDATNVPTSAIVEIKFSQEMNPATINNATFTLKEGDNAIPGDFSYVDSTTTFTPTSDLKESTTFIGVLTTGVKDLIGTAINSEYSFSFTTGLAPDTSLPTVASTDPLNDAVDVEFTKVISATFSEELEPSTINATSFLVSQGGTAVVGTVAYADNTATFTPTPVLLPGLVYDLTITTGVKDMAQNALATAKTWAFKTDILPTVSSVEPLADATNVALDKVISVTFSEDMDPTTIIGSTFLLKKGVDLVVGTVAHSGTTATFTPTANLEAGVEYNVTLTTGVKDLGGNAIAVAKTWVFTTDAIPNVVAVEPLADAIDVPRNKVVSITFNEEMDATTITTTSFKLMEGANTVTGTIQYSGMKASFIPSAILQPGLDYTATVSTAVKDLGGNSLAAAKVWTFRTGASTGLAVVNLRAAANYVILAKTAINNSPTTAITGDIGLSPAATSFITGFSLTDATGFATSSQITGKAFAADMASPTSSNLTTAVENMITAYTDAAGRPTPDYLDLATGNIGGKTLTAGLYKWNTTVTIPENVIISGSADDVWIFQITNDVTMSAAKNITLQGGAQAKNIFWQVAGEVTIGANSHFEGIILCQTGITFQTGATFKGRALAQTAVILDKNEVIKP
jgi:hypothetical protein